MARRERQETLSRLQLYTDPLQHVLIAAVVTAPLVARGGKRVLATAVTAALVIDVDHAIAARSLRVRHTTSLSLRPRSHSLVTAALAGALVAAAAGPLHGWAAFSALGSHLLHDAGDRAAPTPVLWPWRPARQLGRRVQLAGTVLLTTGSAIVAGWDGARARARSAACDRGGS
jgi:membrane-bound metal-dependent hydrolase YbcI (DUF457 family)